MSEIVIENAPDQVSVIVPPESIRIVTETGRTGQRGSIWLSGPGVPGPGTIPNNWILQEHDMYLDSATKNIYQYEKLPNNRLDWTLLFSLT